MLDELLRNDAVVNGIAVIMLMQQSSGSTTKFSPILSQQGTYNVLGTSQNVVFHLVHSLVPLICAHLHPSCLLLFQWHLK